MEAFWRRWVEVHNRMALHL